MPPSSQMAIQLTLVLISCSLYSMYSPSSSSSVSSSSLPASSSLALLILVISTSISLLFSSLRHLLKGHAHKAQTTSPSMVMEESMNKEKGTVLQDEAPEDAPEDSTGSVSESSDCTANDGERAEEDSSSDDDDDEESLIEISLDDGHYVGAGRGGQRVAFKGEKDLLAVFSPDSVLDRRDFLTDILSEIGSEEDGLIEIDFARGSIKCPSFGIKA